ncbi:hypothetical protein SCARR_03711 [Pontiella sulfatireligans]|uniref:Alginate export domain-containing protein n=2 Tax=Pontiella sulfatireligans TaxID=2750658 RepID=A0A6C2UQS2_9BACT|nr:hypothetical protein SCARR_03711 [Pontiella sulfatireligans]
MAGAESIMKPFNDQGYGTISGRVQYLGMYRDYDNGNNGNASTMGIVLNYTTPEVAGFDAGVGYNYAGELFNGDNSSLNANGNINVFNEGWLRYNFGALGYSNTTVLAGRKINNGEIFRADDFRQKSRSIETVQFQTQDLTDTKLTVGHALRMSSWIQVRDLADFNEFNEVFGTDSSSAGVTWGELVNNCVEGLEIALFDAYAWDVANLIGTRVKWDVLEDSAILGYYRHENDVGDASTRNSEAFGLSLQQKIGRVTLEPGYFGVRGSNLRFQEATTGINHALGSLMMIYAGQFNGGTDTAYLKAVTKLEKTDTTLYGLYTYTWNKSSDEAQELNLVVKQPVAKNLTVCFKGGVGYREEQNTTATDARLFATYTF